MKQEIGGIMTQDEIKDIVMNTLYKIAPELEDQVIDSNVNFRDQFDFDSVDFLNFAISLQKKTNIDIPEIDYPKLSSLTGCITYFESKSSVG